MVKMFNAEKVFVLLALLFGFFLIFFTPPLQSPDEPDHFFRAFSVSQGHVTAKKQNNVSGDYLPESLTEFKNKYEYLFFDRQARISFDDIRESQKIVINEQNMNFTNQRYQALYSVFAYAPQAIGILFAKLFTDSVYWIMIGAKLSLLFFYVFLGFHSLKSLPFLKWALFLILLTPMSLSLGASVSADGVLIALSSLFFSKILQYSYSGKNIVKKQFYFLICLTILLALVKQSFLISLFVFFIPREKFVGLFKNKVLDSYLVKLIALIVPALLMSVLWSKTGYELFVPLNSSNPAIQAQFILQHPFIYVKTLTTTLFLNFRILLFEMVGIIGWIDVFLFPITYWFFIFALLTNIFCAPESETNRFDSTFFQKSVLFALIFLNVVFISTIIYVSWSVPYLITPFEGLQGRYYIPLLLPFFTFILLLFNQKYKLKVSNWLIPLNISLIILTYSNLAFGLFIRYYAQF